MNIAVTELVSAAGLLRHSASPARQSAAPGLQIATVPKDGRIACEVPGCVYRERVSRRPGHFAPGYASIGTGVEVGGMREMLAAQSTSDDLGADYGQNEP